MYDLVIRGGSVVTPDGVLSTDVGIFGEKIAALGNALEGREMLEGVSFVCSPAFRSKSGPD